MGLKETLRHFAETYALLNKESKHIVSEITPKITTISDAQLIKRISEQDVYWKHDVPTVISLARRYKVDTRLYENMIRKFEDAMQRASQHKADFEQLGLKDVTVGPKQITGKAGDADISVSFEGDAPAIEITPEDMDFGWTPDFYEKAEDLKFEIARLLNS